MSVEVMNWVWKHSPTKGSELLLLLAIADAANDDGTNAYPSTRTLARKTRLDTRTVQRIVRKLVTEGHIGVSERGGRESNRYAVLMGEQSSTPPADCHPRQNATGGETPPQLRQDATPPLAPVPPQLRHSCATPATAQLCHPTPPIPVRDSSSGGGGGGTNPEAVLDRLGPSWPVGLRQRRRLVPKIEAALTAGWPVPQLVEHLAANPDGVKAPGAVLAARLEDLPPPPQHRQAEPWRSPWCGTCREATRMVEDDDGRPSRCPSCHPKAAQDTQSTR